MNPKEIFRSRAFQIAGVALLALAGGFFAARSLYLSDLQTAVPEDTLYTKDTAQVGEGFQTMANIQAAFRQVAEEVLPTVVEIDVVDVVQTAAANNPSPFQFFFAPQSQNNKLQKQELLRQGLGSGVIVKRAGQSVYVLTNNHVVGEAEQISVKLADGRSYTASLVGADPNKDLALVVFKTDEKVPVAELGDSNTLQVGDWVLAVGSPLGFYSTVTEGIVSAIGRESVPGSAIASFTDYIQTDAAINQGNSGGALVNVEGKVIGISTWIASPSGGNVGLGFAIPINNAKSAIEDFITSGKIAYGWLGVSIGTLSPQEAVDLYGDNVQGAFVYGVYEGSPAEKAGLFPGDTIVSMNGEPISDSTHLLLVVGDLAPGSVARFGILRGDRRLSLQVTLSQRLDKESLDRQASLLWPGVSVVRITPEIRARLDLPRNTGAVIISTVVPGSPAAIAGFQAGDILRNVNEHKIMSLQDFYHAVNQPDSKELVFTVTRQQNEYQVGLSR